MLTAKERLKQRKSREVVVSSRGTVIVMLLLIVFYTCAGGAAFQALEGPWDDDAVKKFEQRCKKERDSKIAEVEKNCTGKSFDSCFKIIRQSVFAVDECLREYSGINPTLPLSNYWNSVVFAFSIYTTLGYGNIVTETKYARAFCMFYAFFGIPLFYAVIKSCQQFLTPTFLWTFYCFHDKLFKPIKRRILRKQQVSPSTSTLPERKSNKIKLVGVKRIGEYRRVFPEAFLIFLIWQFILSLLFQYSVNKYASEPWSYFISFYFVFTTLTMIGFGDVFPEKGETVALYVIPFLFGMCLFFSSFYSIQEEIREQATKVSRSLEMLFRKLFKKKNTNSTTTDLSQTLRDRYRY